MNPNLELYHLLCLKEKLNESIKNQEIFRYSSKRVLFQDFCKILHSSIYRAVVELKPIYCDLCRGHLSESSLQLSCSHYICSPDCFAKLLEMQLDNKYYLYDKLNCPTCGEKISKEITYRVYGGYDNFQRLIKESSERDEVEIVCEICSTVRKASNYITLECEHRYCKDCVKQFIDDLILDGKVGIDLSCPECSKPINPHIVFAVIDNETKDRYERHYLRNSECKPGEVFVSCIGRPGINCEFGQFISKDREEFCCPECGVKFCARCKLDVHPRITCQQQKMIKNYQEPYIKAALEDGSMGLCPWCDTPIEKDKAGCKYMTCKSKICKSKKYFCWDCKKKLNKFHEKHDCTTKDDETHRCGIF